MFEEHIDPERHRNNAASSPFNVLAFQHASAPQRRTVVPYLDKYQPYTAKMLNIAKGRRGPDTVLHSIDHSLELATTWIRRGR
jgi:hypothetical protein